MIICSIIATQPAAFFLPGEEWKDIVFIFIPSLLYKWRADGSHNVNKRPRFIVASACTLKVAKVQSSGTQKCLFFHMKTENPDMLWTWLNSLLVSCTDCWPLLQMFMSMSCHLLYVADGQRHVDACGAGKVRRSQVSRLCWVAELQQMCLSNCH